MPLFFKMFAEVNLTKQLLKLPEAEHYFYLSKRKACFDTSSATKIQSHQFVPNSAFFKIPSITITEETGNTTIYLDCTSIDKRIM